MKFDDLVDRVGLDGLFRTGQILAGQQSTADVRRQLDRWVKKGRVLQLRRGVYVLVSSRGGTGLHPFAAGNALRKASYVSLQSALAHYGMIPEHVPVTTSVTTGRPETLDTPLGRFLFRHVGPRLFFGFREVEIAREQRVLLATPQKALVDLLYLTPGSDGAEYLRELRLTQPERLDLDELFVTAERTGSAKVNRAVKRVIQLWKDEA